METVVKLRIATLDDFVRTVNGQRKAKVGKDFWVKGVKGDLQYYRLNPKNPEVVRMIKQGIPQGLILVVDVEGEEERFIKKVNQ